MPDSLAAISAAARSEGPLAVIAHKSGLEPFGNDIRQKWPSKVTRAFVVVRENPLGRAVEVVILAAFQAPQKSDQTEQPEPERDR